jgi:hypothetical protein
MYGSGVIVELLARLLLSVDIDVESLVVEGDETLNLYAFRVRVTVPPDAVV